MSGAPIPANEQARLAELLRYEILDSAREAEFDGLTRLAAELCDSPIALISLVDAERQWFKSQVGLDVQETPRKLAFCAHSILGEGILEVEDASKDPRFADNALVTGEPDIRFYAGAPLRSSEGFALGTVCVIDRVPRRLSAAQRDGLAAIGRQVMSLLSFRRAMKEARASDSHGVVGASDLSVGVMEMATLPGPRGAPARPEEGSEASMKVGRFTTLYMLGKGAMATVYAAHDRELQRKVAIKFIHGSGGADEQQRFRHEAQALARISHPNVVQIYDSWAVAARTFIAMEFVHGVTLAVWEKSRARTLRETLDMYIQAGRGLVAAHQVGVIHRDFKPKYRRLSQTAPQPTDRPHSHSQGRFERVDVDRAAPGRPGVPHVLAKRWQRAGPPEDQRGHGPRNTCWCVVGPLPIMTDAVQRFTSAVPRRKPCGQ